MYRYNVKQGEEIQTTSTYIIYRLHKMRSYLKNNKGYGLTIHILCDVLLYYLCKSYTIVLYYSMYSLGKEI